MNIDNLQKLAFREAALNLHWAISIVFLTKLTENVELIILLTMLLSCILTFYRVKKEYNESLSRRIK